MIIGFILLYILSGAAWYFSVRYDYKHNHKGFDPHWSEVVVVFVPIINTAFSIFNWMFLLLVAFDEKLQYKFTTAKFFRIKR